MRWSTVVLIALVACSAPTPPIDAAMAPDGGTTTRLYFVSDLVMPLPDQFDSWMYHSDPGLDLDGIVSDGDENATCTAIADVTDPNDPSRRGIDNGWSAYIAFDTVRDLPPPPPPTATMIANGFLPLGFRLSQNGGATTITWGLAVPAEGGVGVAPQLGPDRSVLAGQSMRFLATEDAAPLTIVADGRRGAGIGDFTVPALVLYVGDQLDGVLLRDARLEMTQSEPPVIHGTIGATLTVATIGRSLDAEHWWDLRFSQEVISALLTYGPDLDPSPNDPTACTAFSVGLDFTAVLVSEVSE